MMANPKPCVESKWRATWTVALPALLMAGMVVALIRPIQQAKLIDREIARSSEIVAGANELSTQMSELEEFGTESFEAYANVERATEAARSRFRALVETDPSLAPRMAALDQELNRWQEALHQAVEKKKKVQADAMEARARAKARARIAVYHPKPAVKAKAAARSALHLKPTPVAVPAPKPPQPRVLLHEIAQAADQARIQGESVRDELNRRLIEEMIGLAILTGALLMALFIWQARKLRKAQVEQSQTSAELDQARVSLADAGQQRSELEAAFAESREQTELYRGIVDGARDCALFRLDRDGVIRSWNTGAERVLGRAAGETIGQDQGILFSISCRERGEPARLLRLAAQKGRYAEEGWRVRQDGTTFWAETMVAPIHETSGSVHKVSGYSVLIRDLSRKRREEDELRILFSKVEEAARARDQFLSIASHELKIATQALSEQLPSSAGVPLRRQTGRLSRLVDEMLDLCRVHSGRLGYALRETDLSQLVAESVTQMGEQFQAAGSEVEVQVEPGLRGSCDPVRVQQVIASFLSNALRYGQGKPITVTMASEGGRARIGVLDRGPGIEKDRHRWIFERFSPRSAGSTDEQGEAGFGLGLFIARQIAEGHGGRVWVESEPGAGAKFCLELPLRAGASEAVGLTTSGVSALEKKTAPSGKPGAAAE